MKIKWWHILIFGLVILAVAAILYPTKMRSAWMMQEGNQVEEALLNVLAIYKDNPKHYRSVRAIAQSCEKLGKLVEAERYYQELLELKPADNNFEDVIRFYAWTEQPGKRMAVYQKWYKFRKTSRHGFSDNTGKNLLMSLYAYDLLYKDFEQAIEVLEERRKVDKKNIAVIDNELLTLFERTGDLKKSVALLEKCLRSDRNNIYLLSKFMQIAQLAGKEKAAEELLITNINDNPSNIKSWNLIIAFELNQKNFEAANSWYLRLVDHFAGNENIKRGYLAWLIANNHQLIAIKYLETLIANGEDSPYYADKLFELYEWNNFTGKLLPIYMSKFRENSNDKENAEKLLGILLDRKEYAKSKQVVTKLIQQEPANRKYLLTMVDIYDAEKNPDAAIRLLSNLVKTTNDPKLKKNLAKRYLWAGNSANALLLLDELFVQTPNDPDIYRYKGDILLFSGKQKEAARLYQKCAALSPNDYYPHYRMGEIYRAEKNNTLANEELNQALLLIDTTPLRPSAKSTIIPGARNDDNRLEIHIADARIHALLKNEAYSIDKFETLRQDYPDNLDMGNSYIESLIDMGSFDQAYLVADEYRARYPENNTLLGNMAKIHTSKHEYDRAEEILDFLRTKNPNDPSIQKSYGYLFYDRGDWHKAYPLFEELKEKYPEDKEIRTAVTELFVLYRPQLRAGFGFRKTGGEDKLGPYFKYSHPINSKWYFSADFAADYEATDLIATDPNFSRPVNELDLMLEYKLNNIFTFGGGALNAMEGATFVPGARILVEMDHPKYGRAALDFKLNDLLDDPISALYYDGKKDVLEVNYEKKILERFIFGAIYSTIWYRVDGAKAGGGNYFAREDMAEARGAFILLKKPEIRLGYEFYYSDLHVKNNYLPIIPLVKASKRHNILVGFFHKFNEYFSLDLGGFVGHDSKRNLQLSNLNLYGFEVTPRIKVSKRLELMGHYEYSSESISNAVGRYHYANGEVLYRF